MDRRGIKSRSGKELVKGNERRGIKYEIEIKRKGNVWKKYGIHLFIPSSLNPSIHMFASSEKCNKGLVY